MAKKLHNEIGLAQNFLASPNLVRSMVSASSISGTDIVYEIGPGHGIITAELAGTARRVMAVEIDPLLVRELHERFLHVRNVHIIAGNFLRYRIKDEEYKIFANIPYNSTSEIMRKILCMAPGPSEAYLVMQREAAQKFAGLPRETQFSILAKPLYSLQILRNLQRTDFTPIPGVESVLLHVRRRRPPLISEQDLSLYRNFVHYGFGKWRRNLKSSFKPVFSYEQWKRLSRDLRFRPEAAPSELTFEQWMGLFDFFRQTIVRR